MNEPVPTGPDVDERNWAVFCHLSALLGCLALGVGIIIGPLVLWLWKKDTLPFVDDQGKEALNFQITVLIGGIICTALIWLLIGIPLLVALSIADVVFIIIAAIKTSEGVAYRYPINLRLIK